jgi:hypothetical protein
MYRDMAAIDEEDEGADQWMVLDGRPGGQWAFVMERALMQDGVCICVQVLLLLS